MILLCKCTSLHRRHWLWPCAYEVSWWREPPKLPIICCSVSTHCLESDLHFTLVSCQPTKWALLEELDTVSNLFSNVSTQPEWSLALENLSWAPHSDWLSSSHWLFQIMHTFRLSKYYLLFCPAKVILEMHWKHRTWAHSNWMLKGDSFCFENKSWCENCCSEQTPSLFMHCWWIRAFCKFCNLLIYVSV